MLFGDYSSQTFDWWHAQVPDAFIPGTNLNEDFEHNGLLDNKILNIGFTLGLNDYWNVSLTQMISERCMIWEGPTWQSGDDIPIGYSIGDSKTVHHRTECTSTDFIDPETNEVKAYGGYFGDTRLNFKYLFSNTGKGTGSRIFGGLGLVIPSENTLTESPWAKSDHDGDDDCLIDFSVDCNGIDADGNLISSEHRYSPHRHFYLSDGVYKIFFEAQYFKKRVKIPVFWGGAFSFEFPLNESDYGFRPSKRYDLSVMALSGPVKAIKTNFFKLSSVGFNLTLLHFSESGWDGLGPTPNSEATAVVPGVSLLFDSKVGTFGVNYQTGRQIYEDNPGSIDEEIDISSFTISYRRILDQVIDFLYW